MRVVALMFLFLGNSQGLSLFTRERKAALDISKRITSEGSDDFFPFPANQTAVGPVSPRPMSPGDINFTDSTWGGRGPIKIYFERRCNGKQKKMIVQAFKDSLDLASAQGTIEKGYNYDIPHSQWLGADWNYEGDWRTWNYRRIIENNFYRLLTMYGENAPHWEYIYWYCQPKRGCDDNSPAYSWDSIGTILWSNHMTVFCPKFYERPSLKEVMDKYEDDRFGQKIMENFYRNRAQTMLHEIYHYAQLVSVPRTEDLAYQPQPCWDLAKKQGTGEACLNAESYTMDALAVYVQQHYGSLMPPIPSDEYRKQNPDDPDAAAAPKPEIDPEVPKVVDGPPPDFDGPLVTDDKPDLSIWEEVNLDDLFGPSPEPSPSPTPTSDPTPTPSPTESADPPPGLTDNNACHGISGDYWVMSRDVAMQNVEEFCKQSRVTVEYNQGTVNYLSLNAVKLFTNKGPDQAPDCVGRFQRAVIDGCDGTDPLNNPFNYKFGSTFTSADGWQYKMQPLSKQVNEVSCDVSYKFAYDGFEIRGKDWPDAKLGVWGEGLLHELRGCDSVTKWKFERTPNDCCFQWYAGGQLPIGTKDCVGRAVMSAGGSGNGNCHSKVLDDEPSIDSWPGYGSEWRHVFNNTAD